MIGVVIPCYNAKETISDTLFSIMFQTYKDFKVYLVNDHGDYNYDEEVAFFGNFYQIEEIRLSENHGPGYAREIGLEHADTDYVMFIDNDDVFANPLAFKNLVDTIEEDNKDFVYTNFLYEQEDGRLEKMFALGPLHGKMFRKSFIDKFNIKFNPSPLSSDSGFLQLLILCGANNGYKDVDTYIWRFYPKSITRSNRDNSLQKILPDFVYNINWTIEEGIKRNCDRDKIAHLICFICTYYYLHKNIGEYDTKFPSLKEDLKNLKKLYKEYGLTAEDFYTEMNNQVATDNGLKQNRETFEKPLKDDFMKFINSKGDKL